MVYTKVYSSQRINKSIVDIGSPSSQSPMLINLLSAGALPAEQGRSLGHERGVSAPESVS